MLTEEHILYFWYLSSVLLLYVLLFLVSTPRCKVLVDPLALSSRSEVVSSPPIRYYTSSAASHFFGASSLDGVGFDIKMDKRFKRQPF